MNDIEDIDSIKLFVNEFYGKVILSTVSNGGK
jgi:hypothetical protein